MSGRKRKSEEPDSGSVSRSLSPPRGGKRKLSFEAEFECNLAIGGMGRVDKFTTKCGFRFACKTARSTGSDVTRLKKEITALSKLKHPHIVDLIDAWTVGNDVSYVMPFYPLGSMEDYIHKNKVDGDWAFTVMLQLVAGLEHAHKQKPVMVHRDLKPQNILMEAKAHVRIADWGLVYNADGHTTVNFGSEGYIAPELKENGPDGKPVQPTRQSDIYSLGKVFERILRAVDDNELKEQLEPLLKKMTTRSPKSRLKTCGHVQRTLTKEAAQYRAKAAVETLPEPESSSDEEEPAVFSPHQALAVRNSSFPGAYSGAPAFAQQPRAALPYMHHGAAAFSPFFSNTR